MTVTSVGTSLGTILGIALLLFPEPGTSAAAGPTVREGWDWTLPAHVQPVEYSGYFTWGPRRFDPSITVRGVMVTWRRLNPAPGKYNWDWVRQEIAKNRAAGMRTGIHLKGVQRDAVPDWVIEKYHPVVLDVPVLQDNQPWRIQTVPPWQKDVDRAFHEFMRAFAKTGIAQDPNVVYGYIHGISASRGEEMFVRPADLKMWQETTGVTPEIFADWLRRRIDAMCQVFKGVEYKLAVTWQGPIGPTSEFKATTADLYQHAIDKGTGIRGGGIDFMNALLDAPAWSVHVDAEGYMVVEDDDPIIKEGRFRADENEEYGKYWQWRFGPVDGYTYRHRICALRGLQLRQNFQLVSAATLQLNPELNEYVRITQGYRRHNSPDAWAYLREFRRRRGPVKNIERWLIQRDAPGSKSVPTERIDRFPLPSEKWAGAASVHDCDARRTDIANGQTGLLFGLDKVFWSKPGPATLKVTYTERAPARWHIQYTDPAGTLQRTGSVDNVGDGRRKTATFQLPSLAALGRFPNDSTFEMWANEMPKEVGNRVRNADFSDTVNAWRSPAEYRIVADPDRPAAKLVEFRVGTIGEDTVHMDQMVTLKKGDVYRITASIKNQGTRLKPGVRIGRMDWSTIVYLESTRTGRWETRSALFQANADGPVRLQLFGQGRGHMPTGQAGSVRFRDISIMPVQRKELLGDFKMDFRIVTEGPGDVTVTMVRVVRGWY